MLILDGLPLESYIDKGALADLDGLLDTDGVIPQLLEPFRTENGIFALPTRFGIPALFTTPERSSGWNTLTQLAEAVAAGNAKPAAGDPDSAFSSIPEEQRPVLSFQSWQEFFDLFYSANASPWPGGRRGWRRPICALSYRR